MEEFRRQQRQGRKSKVQPSQADRSRKKPKRRPGERYRRTSYFQAIETACDKAFPPPGELARRKLDAPRGWRWETRAEWKARLGEAGWAEVKRWQAEHRWHPNQLRHSYLTEVRRRYGLEAAQVIAGHAKADVTQVYAERDLGLAEKVAAEMG